MPQDFQRVATQIEALLDRIEQAKNNPAQVEQVVAEAREKLDKLVEEQAG